MACAARMISGLDCGPPGSSPHSHSAQYVTVRGKGDRERVLIVTERAREAVDEYLDARDDPSPALFISFQPKALGPRNERRRDNRLSDDGARHICHELARRLDIPPFHPHQLPHTLGTLLQETVGDARLTADTLGHVGLASVAGYTKITEGRRRLAQEEMEAQGL
jgi:site-specific recombinase XerD